MKPRIFPFLAVLLALALLPLATGCGKNNMSAGKGWQISNETDDFQLLAEGMQNYSTIENYFWTNTGTVASIRQACYIPEGIGTIRITDGSGALVYSRNLVDTGTFTSMTGAAGSWTIHIELTDLDGTLDLRVQKKS